MITTILAGYARLEVGLGPDAAPYGVGGGGGVGGLYIDNTTDIMYVCRPILLLVRIFITRNE